MPRIASLSPHELRGCTLRVTLTTLLRLRLESRQIRADSGRSYEGCRKSEDLECRRAVRHWRGALFFFGLYPSSLWVHASRALLAEPNPYWSNSKNSQHFSKTVHPSHCNTQTRINNTGY